jgi:hypothetical protein
MKSFFRIALVAGGTLALAACAPRAATPSATPESGTSAPTVAAATTTPATTASGAPSTVQPATAGTISGLVGYPAEGHPALTICAFGATDRTVHHCVDVPQAIAPPKSPYAISGVAPGAYHLFAYAAGNDRAGGAYTEYVRCGLQASCSDHTLVDVVVRAGETVRDIEVSDWYGPTGSFPPRPR